MKVRATVGLFLVALLGGCTPILQEEPVTHLTPAEQFSEVTQKYPAVATHLFQADLTMDLFMDLRLLIDNDAVVEIDGFAERVQTAQRLWECREVGFSTCPRITCSTSAADCENCSPDDLGCSLRRVVCMNSATLRCSIVPEQ